MNSISNRWSNYQDTLIGGSAKSAGFVKRMEAEKKIQFQKISRPSKYMINKYGNRVEVHEPFEDYGNNDDDYDNHVDPTPISRFDNYNVGKPKKKVKNNKSALTEVQEERLEAEKRKKEDELHKVRQHLESLKLMVTDYKSKLGKQENAYHKELNDLKHKHGLRKTQKDDLQEQLIVNHHKTIKQMKTLYPQLFAYMKQNKLADINLVFKHVNNKINKA
jgi:hypothetical protein